MTRGEWDRALRSPATIDDFALDDKEALIDLLLRVQSGNISCRRMASEIIKRIPPNASSEVLVRLKPNGQPSGTFLVTIDDGYVEYTYPLRPRSKSWSVHKIYTVIRKAFRVREEEGKIRKPNNRNSRDPEGA